MDPQEWQTVNSVSLDAKSSLENTYPPLYLVLHNAKEKKLREMGVVCPSRNLLPP
jgi:hypothetical protein